MDILLETQILPGSENKGKTYIDPNSTQVFIEALVKLKESGKGSDIESDSAKSANSD